MRITGESINGPSTTNPDMVAENARYRPGSGDVAYSLNIAMPTPCAHEGEDDHPNTQNKISADGTDYHDQVKTLTAHLRMEAIAPHIHTLRWLAAELNLIKCPHLGQQLSTVIERGTDADDSSLHHPIEEFGKLPTRTKRGPH